MKRLALAAVGLALVVAMGASTKGAAQSPPPPATVFQACSVAYPGSIAVTFAWPPTTGALQQWVDLSLSDSGFLPDTFLGVGSVVPTRWTHNTFTWDGILPGLSHFYRINVLYPDGWVAVASGSFVSIGDCPKPTASEGRVASVECEAGGAMRVTLSWVPGGGTSQWLDYNYNRSVEDMAWDSYWSQGPLAPGTNSFELLLGATGYSWRVNTLSAEGWSPSPIWFLDGSSLCGPQAPPAAPPTPVPPPPTPPSVLPPPLPSLPNPIPGEIVIQTCIDGTFTGWSGYTAFELCNGQVWMQSSYSYMYHYAYRPDVVIYNTGFGYRMQVEGVPDTVDVTPITDFIRTCIDGDFEGWEGDTVFELCNGQVWMQSSYSYTYHYAYRPDVVIYNTGFGYRMQVEGVNKTIAVVRLR